MKGSDLPDFPFISLPLLKILERLLTGYASSSMLGSSSKFQSFEPGFKVLLSSPSTKAVLRS
jgi:hypothetical protein